MWWEFKRDLDRSYIVLDKREREFLEFRKFWGFGGGSFEVGGWKWFRKGYFREENVRGKGRGSVNMFRKNLFSLDVVMGLVRGEREIL